jgi:soluble lytic murein transglycosylase-like protein
LLFVSVCEAGGRNWTIDQCKKYLPQVKREAHYHIGLDAPVHLFMGQIEQESRCNESVTAFDGGMGLGQFMPATAEWMQEREAQLRELSLEASPYDPKWAIRALILYDRYLYGVVICKDDSLYFALRAYNGGAGLLNREIRRAGTCEYSLIEKQCRRKVIRLKSGKFLDLCKDVNLKYYKQIKEKGEKYK